MDWLQKLIHRLEVGGGMRYFRWGTLALALVLVTLLYDGGGAKNMATQEAMDSAQLARNIAQGRGYTTYFIRPLSLSLTRQHNQAKRGVPPLGAPKTDYAQLEANHPDLANPPVYPCVLALLMKVCPFHYPVDTTKAFWSPQGRFWRYQPDFIITAFNQVLFFVTLALVFLLARRLFDTRTAALASAILFGSELFWRFSASGLSTMLVLLIFTGLLWCVALLEEELREPKWGRGRLFVLAALTGALVGVGMLTRYSFGWLILPVLVFVLLFSGRQRAALAALALVGFVAVAAPWLVRNSELSGLPFGTATYAVVEGTPAFPGHQLERSMEPNLGLVSAQMVRQKLLVNVRSIMQNDVPRLGGSWVAGFFLVGLLLSFTNPAARRLRYFLLMALGVLALTQALGRTQLSDDSPELNSENLLVLLAPCIVVYGASLFFLLLDQVDFRFRQLRLAVVGLFVALVCLPLLLFLVPVALTMVLHFQPPYGEPLAFPPYYPPAIQTAGGWATNVPARGPVVAEKDLPQRVKDTLLQEVPGAKVTRAEKQDLYGGAVYKVTSLFNDTCETTLWIAPDGTRPKVNGLVMSDVPWAVAWYGRAQSVWLSLRVAPDIRELSGRKGPTTAAPEDFFSINDVHKAIDALFLTRVTLDKLDSRTLIPTYLSGEQTWGSLFLQTVPFFPKDLRSGRAWPAVANIQVVQPGEVLPGEVISMAPRQIGAFPLHYWQSGWPEFFLLTLSKEPLR